MPRGRLCKAKNFSVPLLNFPYNIVVPPLRKSWCIQTLGPFSGRNAMAYYSQHIQVEPPFLCLTQGRILRLYLLTD